MTDESIPAVLGEDEDDEDVGARVDELGDHVSMRIGIALAILGKTLRGAAMDAGAPPHTLYRPKGRSLSMRYLVSASKILDIPEHILLGDDDLVRWFEGRR